MQAYRDMDIGTAKPNAAIRRDIRHELIDIADPEDDLTVVEYQRLGRSVLDESNRDGARIIIAGGSGLHFRSLVDPLTFAPSDPSVKAELEAAQHDDLVERLMEVDPSAGEVVDLQNPRRVIRALEVHRLTGATPSDRARSPEAESVRHYIAEVPFMGFGVDGHSATTHRVTERFDAMLDAGLVEEVRSLSSRMGRAARQAVGYKELLPVISGTSSLADARQDALSATMALVKRQRTFFRRDPRIAWLPWQDDDATRTHDTARAIGEAAGWTS